MKGETYKMQIEIACVKSNIISENPDNQGQSLKVKTEYPVVSVGGEDDAICGRLNTYYARISEELCKSAARAGCDMNVSCRTAYSDEDFFSVYFDVKQYRARELVSYLRFCDSRRKDGFMIPPSDVFVNVRKMKAKGLVTDIYSWYITKDGIVMFVNRFAKGMGAGIRRSDEGKFIETHMAEKADLRPEWIRLYDIK